MPDFWSDRLAEELRGARRIVLVGIGNPAKGDDGAGPLCAARLQKKLWSEDADRVLVLDGRDVPESRTGEIRKFGPDLTLLIDAAIGGLSPGGIFFIERDKIADESVSTHQIPVGILARYIEESIGGRVLVLGIQPEALGEGEPISTPVERSALALADFIAAVLKEE